MAYGRSAFARCVRKCMRKDQGVLSDVCMDVAAWSDRGPSDVLAVQAEAGKKRDVEQEAAAEVAKKRELEKERLFVQKLLGQAADLEIA